MANMNKPDNLYEYDGYEIPEYDPNIPPEERGRLKTEAHRKLLSTVARVRAMRRQYSEEELDALDHKFINPDKIVRCPRCGNEIKYEKQGDEISVKCLSKDCIWGGIREF